MKNTEFFCVTDGDFYYNFSEEVYMKMYTKLNKNNFEEIAFSSREEAEKALAMLKEKMSTKVSFKVEPISKPV